MLKNKLKFKNNYKLLIFIIILMLFSLSACSRKERPGNDFREDEDFFELELKEEENPAKENSGDSSFIDENLDLSELNYPGYPFAKEEEELEDEESIDGALDKEAEDLEEDLEDLEEEEEEALNLEAETSPLIYLPVNDFFSRINKKFYGTKVSPDDSPVSPERFTGFHTGVDIEYGDIENDVPVFAITKGEVIYSNWTKGYGGVVVLRQKIDSINYQFLYGHLDHNRLPKLGTIIEGGENFAFLGKAYSNETDGERRHLHLSIFSGSSLNLKGYVSNLSELNLWLDPISFLKKYY